MTDIRVAAGRKIAIIVHCLLNREISSRTSERATPV